MDKHTFWGSVARPPRRHTHIPTKAKSHCSPWGIAGFKCRGSMLRRLIDCLYVCVDKADSIQAVPVHTLCSMLIITQHTHIHTHTHTEELQQQEPFSSMYFFKPSLNSKIFLIFTGFDSLNCLRSIQKKTLLDSCPNSVLWRPSYTI